jgi:hypothetical protein
MNLPDNESDNGKSTCTLSCPSTSARDPEARVFGVVLGSSEAPEVAYLKEPVLLSALDTTLPPDVQPTEIYRLAGPCAQSACQHYSGSHCRLGEHLATTLNVVTRALPPCSIRHECRWFHEQRAQACLRCPQVVTEVQAPLGRRTSPKREGKRLLPVV